MTNELFWRDGGLIKPLTPSSSTLVTMIASAEAKFAADREQSAARKEARRARLQLRGWIAAEQTKQRIRRWGC